MLSEKDILESAILVVRFQRGDREAFAALVRIWEQRLFFYIRRLVATEADAWELLQDTWLKLFRSLSSLRDPRSFPAFMYRTGRNVVMSRLRRKALPVEQYTEEALGDDSPDAMLLQIENVEIVRRVLEQLPPAQREVLTLYFLQDLTLEEIADLTEVPLGTVKSRLHYAKAACRDFLSGDET